MCWPCNCLIYGMMSRSKVISTPEGYMKPETQAHCLACGTVAVPVYTVEVTNPHCCFLPLYCCTFTVGDPRLACQNCHITFGMPPRECPGCRVGMTIDANYCANCGMSTRGVQGNPPANPPANPPTNPSGNPPAQ